MIKLSHLPLKALILVGDFSRSEDGIWGEAIVCPGDCSQWHDLITTGINFTWVYASPQVSKGTHGRDRRYLWWSERGRGIICEMSPQSMMRAIWGCQAHYDLALVRHPGCCGRARALLADDDTRPRWRQNPLHWSHYQHVCLRPQAPDWLICHHLPPPPPWHSPHQVAVFNQNQWKIDYMPNVRWTYYVCLFICLSVSPKTVDTCFCVMMQ